MSNVTTDVRKLAADHYDIALAAGSFNVADIIDNLTTDLVERMADGDQSVTVALISLAARQAVDAIDKARAVEEQESLFGALDRPIKLGDGERLAYRFLTAQGWSKHLGHVGDNAAKVNASAARENRRFAALATYLVGAKTTEQALVMWQTANPGKDLP